MIGSVLVANRGEIARRVMRTARRLGMRTIAVYSEADAGALFVREADEAIPIGPAPAKESYLRGEKIIAAARDTGAEAIHPGYGFLSESAEFAEQVTAAGLIWVGAPSEAIRAMGRKDAAKRLVAQAGIAVTPGYAGEDQTDERLFAEARGIGFPVLIKAVAGGGGKGMRRVNHSGDFADALAACRREALSAFGDEMVLIEKYIASPRHLEVQVFGDLFGNIVHFFERDCTVQRRHQKIIEEAPAPGMDMATRNAICDMAVRAAQAVNYVGAGTIEFIADASAGVSADRLWFMEMNTRLQVEHPVTEAITGEDLVEWQFRIAAGEPLPKAQHQIVMSGWAMEARFNAEDPSADFRPSTGLVQHLRFPQGPRLESAVEEGDSITAFYDSLIAKLIVHAPTREAATRELARSCTAVEVWPIRTNASLLATILSDPDFIAANFDTHFIERRGQHLIPVAFPTEDVVAAAARLLVNVDSSAPWLGLPGFRLNSDAPVEVAVAIDGRIHRTQVDLTTDNHSTVRRIDGERILFVGGRGCRVRAPVVDDVARAMSKESGAVLSPMPGRVVTLDVAEGDHVIKGQRLLTVEAMKMEMALTAPLGGIVSLLAAALGDQIEEGRTVVTIAPENA